MRRIERSHNPVETAPAAAIVGTAWIAPVARPDGPSRLIVDDVTFSPGSHTIWHTHPCGQLLLVTAGAGWLQARGRAALKVRDGDAVWIEPGEEHWHGATPDQLLRHLSIQEHEDGKQATLGEPLTDDSYPPNPPTESAR